LIDTLRCLKNKHGERLDSELAGELGVPLSSVRQRLSGLAATGEIITCNLTRFEAGKPVEGLLCRITGLIPPKTPGRKPNPAA
jgi:predicted ArsR family transcriptional regulator